MNVTTPYVLNLPTGGNVVTLVAPRDGWLSALHPLLKSDAGGGNLRVWIGDPSNVPPLGDVNILLSIDGSALGPVNAAIYPLKIKLKSGDKLNVQDSTSGGSLVACVEWS